MKLSAIKACLLSIAVLLPMVSSAATVYRYTYVGAPEYEYVSSGMDGGLTPISGYIDLAAPIESGNYDLLTPIAYSFTDGVTTITQDSVYNYAHIGLFADENGEITDWLVNIEYQGSGAVEPERHIKLYLTPGGEWTAYCSPECQIDPFTDVEQALTSNFASAGIASPYWVATVVPVPAAVWLFGSALGMLGWMKRKAL